MQDPNQKVPPIVWQLRYQKQFERPKSLLSASKTVLSGCRAFPGTATFFDPVYAWTGICWDTEKSIVRYVYKHSPAEALGLQPGDVFSGDSCLNFRYAIRKFYLGSKCTSAYCKMFFINCTNSHKIELSILFLA